MKGERRREGCCSKGVVVKQKHAFSVRSFLGAMIFHASIR